MEWYVFALISALMMGINGVMAKKLLYKKHSSDYVMQFCMISWLFLLPFMKYFNFDISWKIVGTLYLKSILLTIAWLTSAKAVRHLEISFVQPLVNFNPLILLGLSMIILGEKISWINLGGILLLTFGGYLLAAHYKKGKGSIKEVIKNKYVLLLLLSLVFVSFCAIIDKKLTISVGAYTMIMFTFFFTGINCIIYKLMRGDLKKSIISTKNHLPFLMIIIILQLVGDVAYFNAVAIPGAMIALIIPIKRTSTIFATIVGGELFHDHGLKQRIIACVVMVIGAALIIV